MNRGQRSPRPWCCDLCLAHPASVYVGAANRAPTSRHPAGSGRRFLWFGPGLPAVWPPAAGDPAPIPWLESPPGLGRGARRATGDCGAWAEAEGHHALPAELKPRRGLPRERGTPTRRCPLPPASRGLRHPWRGGRHLWGRRVDRREASPVRVPRSGGSGPRRFSGGGAGSARRTYRLRLAPVWPAARSTHVRTWRKPPVHAGCQSGGAGGC